MFKNKDRILRRTFKPETMTLLGSNKNKITKDKNGEHVLNLEITAVGLLHCNIVNNNCQQQSRVLHTFIPDNRSFGQLLGIFPKNSKFLEIFNSEYLYVQVWFTDQNSKPLHEHVEIDIILVIN